MKYALCLIIAFGMLTPLASRAQTMPTDFNDSDFIKQAAIQRTIVTVIGEIQNNFEKYKGSLLKTGADGNTYYAVKDLDMGTPTQYIRVNAQGAAMYIAVFSTNKLDAKLPFLASAAFSGLDMHYGFVVTKIDTDNAKGILRYNLSFSDMQPATYLFDMIKLQGTLLVGRQ